jgi:hypothetical protein
MEALHRLSNKSFPLPRWEGTKGRVITPTQTLPHQGGGLLARLQELLNRLLTYKL